MEPEYKDFRKEVRSFCKEWKGVNFKDSAKIPLTQAFKATGSNVK